MKKIILLTSMLLLYLVSVASVVTANISEDEFPGPFESRVSHEMVPEIKESLTVLAYDHFSNTELYGPQTASAVQTFQEDYGLTADGILRYEDYLILMEEAEKPLRNPMYREDAVEVKQLLTKAGFGSFSNTTYFGPQTEAAVRSFQEYYQLEITGEVGDETSLKLTEVAESPFQNGRNHEDTPQIKRWLTTLGYGSFSNTTFYGPQTESTVKEFQEDHQLKTNGIADTITLNKLEELAEGDLRNPMYRDDVIQLKLDLTKAGFGSFSNTNYFGPQTERTVRDFQSYYGMTVDGIVGSSTLDQLAEIVDSPFQNGEYHDETPQLKQWLEILGYDSFSNTRFYGPQTADAVERFQADHDLIVSGIADRKTMTKLEEAAGGFLSNPMYREDVIDLKNDLTRLGFGNFSNTDYFGPQTERAVKRLQSYYGLRENGVYDSSTQEKVKEILAHPLQEGNRDQNAVKVKEWLYTLGYGSFGYTTLYGPVTASTVAKFQENNDLPISGIAEPNTFAKLKEKAEGPLTRGMYREDAIELKHQLSVLRIANFESPTNYYGPQTESAIKKFQSENELTQSGIADNQTLTKITEKYNEIPLREYNLTLSQFLNQQMGYNPQTDLYGGGWQTAKSEDVITYLNPNRYAIDNENREAYQFLDLSEETDISESQLNELLRGTLQNTGNIFKDAGKDYGVNEIYLVSHASLETGNGTSMLSTGQIKVAQLSSSSSTRSWIVKRPEREGSSTIKTYLIQQNFNTSLNRWEWGQGKEQNNVDESKLDFKAVYNMFGIQAVDSDPYNRGGAHAFQQGWIDVESSIRGGASFISGNYLARGQNTLYKMRWDPDYAEARANGSLDDFGRGRFQYATDIGWAYKQTARIHGLYRTLGYPDIQLEIPVFK